MKIRNSIPKQMRFRSQTPNFRKLIHCFWSCTINTTRFIIISLFSRRQFVCWISFIWFFLLRISLFANSNSVIYSSKISLMDLQYLIEDGCVFCHNIYSFYVHNVAVEQNIRQTCVTLG